MPGSARPTSGRARAALFDLLGARLPGARVLDLYAGPARSGSRPSRAGRPGAVLVEPDADALLRQPRALGRRAEEEVRVLREPAARALSRLGASRERFDVVFADPPYGDVERLEAELAGLAGVLAAGGVVVVQTDARLGGAGPSGAGAASRPRVRA